MSNSKFEVFYCHFNLQVIHPPKFQEIFRDTILRTIGVPAEKI